MEQEKLILQLKKFRAIEPDPAFTSKSRALILSMNKRKVFLPRFVWAGSFAFAMIFIAVLSFKLIGQGGSPSLSLNSDDLKKELSNMTISIELGQISYEQEVNQAIASAINEITENQTKHLNSSILESENNKIDFNETINPEIDHLLDQVIF